MAGFSLTCMNRTAGTGGVRKIRMYVCSFLKDRPTVYFFCVVVLTQKKALPGCGCCAAVRLANPNIRLGAPSPRLRGLAFTGVHLPFSLQILRAPDFHTVVTHTHTDYRAQAHAQRRGLMNSTTATSPCRTTQGRFSCLSTLHSTRVDTPDLQLFLS